MSRTECWTNLLTCVRHLVLLLVAVHTAGPVGWCCQTTTVTSASPACAVVAARSDLAPVPPSRGCCAGPAHTAPAHSLPCLPAATRCCCPRDVAPPQGRVQPDEPGNKCPDLAPLSASRATRPALAGCRRALNPVSTPGGRSLRLQVWNCCWLC